MFIQALLLLIVVTMLMDLHKNKETLVGDPEPPTFTCDEPQQQLILRSGFHAIERNSPGPNTNWYKTTSAYTGFGYTFSKPPQVFLSVIAGPNAFRVNDGNQKMAGYYVSADNITTTGFDLNVNLVMDWAIQRMVINWYAFGN